MLITVCNILNEVSLLLVSLVTAANVIDLKSFFNTGSHYHSAWNVDGIYHFEQILRNVRWRRPRRRQQQQVWIIYFNWNQFTGDNFHLLIYIKFRIFYFHLQCLSVCLLVCLSVCRRNDKACAILLQVWQLQLPFLPDARHSQVIWSLVTCVRARYTRACVCCTDKCCPAMTSNDWTVINLSTQIRISNRVLLNLI